MEFEIHLQSQSVRKNIFAISMKAKGSPDATFSDAFLKIKFEALSRH
jgi:hypothetical protein